MIIFIGLFYCPNFERGKLMKVVRKQKLITKNIEVGDQINIELDGFGKFTATAQKITDEGTLFMFDECITSRPMNSQYSNEGGYQGSDLRRWLNEELIKAFPKKLQKKIKTITIPTYGQIFGHENKFYNQFESDNDERFPAMENRKNRIMLLHDDTNWRWLQNTTKKEVSATDFAVVGVVGGVAYTGASSSLGILPIFLLIR